MQNQRLSISHLAWADFQQSTGLVKWPTFGFMFHLVSLFRVPAVDWLFLLLLFLLTGFRESSWLPSSGSWRKRVTHLERCLKETWRSSLNCMIYNHTASEDDAQKSSWPLLCRTVEIVVLLMCFSSYFAFPGYFANAYSDKYFLRLAIFHPFSHFFLKNCNGIFDSYRDFISFRLSHRSQSHKLVKLVTSSWSCSVGMNSQT